MKVYLKPQAGLSRAMDRVARALQVSLPSGVHAVDSPEQADLTVLHVIGYPETAEAIEKTSNRVASIQYCVRTTQEPSTTKWRPLWEQQSCVWSYYDLNALLTDDGDGQRLRNFYYAPMGVDPVFREWKDVRRFRAIATGMVSKSECLGEIVEATKSANAYMALVGGNEVKAEFAVYPHVKTWVSVTDDVMAQLYSRADYVCGLRRDEGFEMPALEGIVCGAIPILFDQPSQRKWFSHLACFIKETEDIHEQLVKLFNSPDIEAMRVSCRHYWQERKAQFDWRILAGEFWDRALSKPARIAARRSKPTLLWLGDAAVPSGFAACTHGILDNGLAKKFDTTVIGINYRGAPGHPYPYPIWPCQTEPYDTPMGEVQLARQASRIRPDLIVIQQDPWNIPGYMRRLKEAGLVGKIPIVGAIAVDGENCRGNALKDLDLAVFWTKFGQSQAVAGGYPGMSAVIGLGVNQDVFKPMDRDEARKEYGIPVEFRDRFIVGYVGRNQPRKRLDLLIHYFAQWVKEYDRQDAMLHLHVAPTGDDAFDLGHLMRYYFGPKDRRLILTEADFRTTDKDVAMMLAGLDLFATATQAEGWCLPVAEAMACGIPTLFGRWSALAEWPEHAGYSVPCTNIAVTERRINSIGGIPDRLLFIEALEEFYSKPSVRSLYSQRGLEHVAKFTWESVGQAWVDVIDEFMSIRKQSVA